MGIRGIDVSNHQGLIDWAAVKNSGIEFAWIKATQGINFQDQYFESNWKAAKEVGLIRGAYHFPEPYNNPDARNEADFFINFVNQYGLEEGDMLCLDMETTHPRFDGPYGDWALYWLQIIESYVGYKPVLYTAPTYILRLQLYNEELSQYGLWLASWVLNHTVIREHSEFPSAPNPWDLVAFWQYTDKGYTPGVPGNCDLDLFNGTREQCLMYGKPPEILPPINSDILIQCDSINNSLLEIQNLQSKIEDYITVIAKANENIRRLVE